MAGPEAEGWGLERTFRIMPHILEGEGHFMAVLRKEGEPETAVKAGNRDQLYLDGRKRKEVFRDYEPFIRDTLSEPDTFLERKEYVLFGDQLYLMPADMPDMKGLKILRPVFIWAPLKRTVLSLPMPWPCRSGKRRRSASGNCPPPETA